MTQRATDESSATFGPYRLSLTKRVLEREGIPVAVGSRALELLIALVKRPGQVLTSRELTALVWPGAAVDASSVRVQVAALRKVLSDGLDGARYIQNVAGRGYSFVERVSSSSEVDAAPAQPKSGVTSVSRIPPKPKRMVGRDEIAAQLAEELIQFRFISIVGPGGMGKTTVAVSLAHSLAAEFNGAVHFVDLGSLLDPKSVANAVANAVGLEIQSYDALTSVLTYLRRERALLIFDSCEHVIDAVAQLAEDLHRYAPGVHIVVTSREALRVDGERVHWLPPLGSPPPGARMSVEEVRSYPAVQLFIDRANADGGSLELDETAAGVISEICSKLDGIALAIELTASRVRTYGLEGTSELLANRFRLHWEGRRSALARHQTLNALLDWSYNLLSDAERKVLRRTAIIVGVFSRSVAKAVATDAEDTEQHVMEAIDGLVAKSLLASELHPHEGSRYRLLETTRAYGLDRLIASGEAEQVSRRHAEYFAARIAEVDSDRFAFERPEQSQSIDEDLGNLRSALEWCFGASGDEKLGVELTAAAAATLLDLSLMSECRHWCEKALSVVSGHTVSTTAEMKIQEALSLSSMFMTGTAQLVGIGLTRALELAESEGAKQYQLRLLAGQNLLLSRTGDCRAGPSAATLGYDIALEANEPVGLMVAESMLGASYSLGGNPALALSFCDSGLSRPVPEEKKINFIGYAQSIRARAHRARALWLLGFPERAMEAAKQVIRDAADRDHSVTVCISLVYTISVFMWCGDWSVAGEAIEALIARAERHALAPFAVVGIGFRGELLIRSGHPFAGASLLKAGLQAMRNEQHNVLASQLITALAEGLATTAQLSEALSLIDETIRDAEAKGALFDLPELLRVKASILLRDVRQEAEAEQCLLRSSKVAASQGALGWELRTSLSRAKRRHAQGRTCEAREIVLPVYERFSEGFATVDLIAARDFLRQISPKGQ